MPEPRDPSEGYTIDEAVIAQMYEHEALLKLLPIGSTIYQSTPSQVSMVRRHTLSQFALFIAAYLLATAAFAADFPTVIFHQCFDGHTCTFNVSALPPHVSEKTSIRIAQTASPALSVTITKLKHKIMFSSISSGLRSSDKLVVKLNITANDRASQELPLDVALWLSEDQQLDDQDRVLTRATISSEELLPDQPVKVKLKDTSTSGIRGMFAIVTVGDDNGEIDQLVEEIGRPGCTKHTLVIDTEPNNVTADSQKLGKIRPGTCYTVRGNILINTQGTIERPGEFDFDGFRMQVQVDQLIVATLTHGEDNDYDLGYYDVVNENFVETCEESFTPEVCELTVSGLAAPAPVDLVILPFEGTGNYTLDITAMP